jgi:hypothetical protein
VIVESVKVMKKDKEEAPKADTIKILLLKAAIDNDKITKVDDLTALD